MNLKMRIVFSIHLDLRDRICLEGYSSIVYSGFPIRITILIWFSFSESLSAGRERHGVYQIIDTCVYWLHFFSWEPHPIIWLIIILWVGLVCIGSVVAISLLAMGDSLTELVDGTCGDLCQRDICRAGVLCKLAIGSVHSEQRASQFPCQIYVSY